MSKFSTTTVDDSGDVHGQVTLAIGSAGLPVIAYTSQSGEVRLAEQIDGEWIITKPPCGTATRDEYRISLDLDSGSEPHIALTNAFTDPQTNARMDRLVYGRRGQQWEFEVVPTEGGLFPGSVRFPSMKLYKGFREVPLEKPSEPFDVGDKPFKDAPHICYQAGLHLRHAAKLFARDINLAVFVPPQGATPVWEKHVDDIDILAPEAGWFATCDIGTDDTLRVAYFARRLDDSSWLRVATMDRTEQVVDRPDPFADGWFRKDVDTRQILGDKLSLAQSINGAVAVSYLDRSTPLTLHLGLFGPLGPPLVEVVTNDVALESWSSVAVNFKSQPCVVYGFDGRLKFATRTTANTFAIEDVEAGGDWPSMVFNDDGNAQIAHVAGGTLRFVVAQPEHE
jgi:hypothetical protein